MEQTITNKPLEPKKFGAKIMRRQGIIKRVILWSLAVVLVAMFISVIINSFSKGIKLSASSIPEAVDAVGDYADYLEKYPQNFPEGGFELTAEDAVSDFTLLYEYDDPALKTDSEGSVSWTFNVPKGKEGFYNILVDYIPELDKGSNIERKIILDGEVPYDNLANVSFQRVWVDGGEKIVDINGNEIKPVQVEAPERRLHYVRDQIGYVTEPYLIYFTEGNHTLTIESVRETMSIFKVHVIGVQRFKTYQEAQAEYEAKGYKVINGGLTGYETDPANPLIEGENAVKRSSSTIYAISDRSSAYTSPSDPVKIILNTIGGVKWSTPGDWITWEFDVPESGLYNISFRVKQATNRGLFSTRKLFVNGEIPFAEAQNIKFTYSSDWSIVTAGSEEEAYYFYLEQGKNQITLEVTLGDYGSQINRIQNAINRLNGIYRSIITITGSAPDKFQDYRLVEKIPNLLEDFRDIADTIYDVSDVIARLSGGRSSETASLDTMARMLDSFIKKPRSIQSSLKSFSDNITALGTWIINVSNQALTLDYIIVHASDYDLPKAFPNWFGSTWFGLRAFFKSFLFDYSSVGTTEQNVDATKIEVWLLTSATTGREQGNSIRTLIDATFSKDYNVDLKVVDPSVLLNATLTGRGPDVAINVDNGLPVNYALRGATYDISVFDDFEEVKSWFHPSAVTPYEYDGGYYALPNTQTFLMMFYRADIFESEGWEVPNTWTDVINIIPELQIQNLGFYLPLNTVGAASVVNQIFASRLYQTGGSIYRTAVNDKGETYVESNFDSEVAMQAFEFWSQFYTDYSFQLTDAALITFINRFRTGRMPIGIANYDTYNTLMVSAPELRGKWNFALLPGTEMEDGSIDRHGAASGTAVTMMKQTQIPEAAWEFMKWWVSAETQVAYNREIESIIGTAARHATANIEAFQQLPWTKAEMDILMEQFQWTVGVPEVAGGYYTGRSLENAFRKTVNGKYNPRQTLEEYIILIDREITRKRKEFGLPVATGE